LSIFLYTRILEFVIFCAYYHKTDDTLLSLYVLEICCECCECCDTKSDYMTCGITKTEAQSICNTSGLNYLSKEEVINLSCISQIS